MQQQFSPEIIEKCQKLVFKRAGIHITEDQAERCLEKLARLAKLAFETLIDNKLNEKPHGKNNPP
jgi:hypothetical protein